LDEPGKTFITHEPESSEDSEVEDILET
jgi:hypothetical protein